MNKNILKDIAIQGKTELECKKIVEIFTDAGFKNPKNILGQNSNNEILAYYVDYNNNIACCSLIDMENMYTVYTLEQIQPLLISKKLSLPRRIIVWTSKECPKRERTLIAFDTHNKPICLYDGDDANYNLERVTDVKIWQNWSELPTQQEIIQEEIIKLQEEISQKVANLQNQIDQLKFQNLRILLFYLVIP
jgi:hypothetical protein